MMEKELPILYNGDMMPAILSLVKSQTRRIRGLGLINEDPDRWRYGGGASNGDFYFQTVEGEPKTITVKCPYGKVGDRLWIREKWQAGKLHNDTKPRDLFETARIRYVADGSVSRPAPDDYLWGKVRPSIFIPRWASRLLHEITSIRPQRIQDISQGDAKAEGAIIGQYYTGADRQPMTYREAFEDLWNSVHGADAWQRNDWVWALGFKEIERKGESK